MKNKRIRKKFKIKIMNYIQNLRKWKMQFKKENNAEIRIIKTNF